VKKGAPLAASPAPAAKPSGQINPILDAVKEMLNR
jgi:hypothetical protein